MMEMIEPVVRADAIAHVVFERRDMGAMGRFLVDFGFVALGSEQDGRQYFRGFGADAYCVELVASDRDAFVGFALRARTRSDLDRMADAEGHVVEAIEGPGGGMRIRLYDPIGFRVDLVWGAEVAEPLPVRVALTEVNRPGATPRVNNPVRTELTPAPVFRIGHVVLQTPCLAETADWYRRRFGFLPSDLATVADGTPALGFFRLDRGNEPADHHSLALLAGPEPKLLHVSTETIDIDAVGQGQQYLRGQGWTHYWGIGRHVLGSQIFDYWKDVAGDEWEHYADGDQMTADYPVGIHPLSRGGLWAWGHDLPESMRPPGPPPPEAPPFVHDLVGALMVPPRPWLR